MTSGDIIGPGPGTASLPDPETIEQIWGQQLAGTLLTQAERDAAVEAMVPDETESRDTTIAELGVIAAEALTAYDHAKPTRMVMRRIRDAREKRGATRVTPNPDKQRREGQRALDQSATHRVNDPALEQRVLALIEQRI